MRSFCLTGLSAVACWMPMVSLGIVANELKLIKR